MVDNIGNNKGLFAAINKTLTESLSLPEKHEAFARAVGVVTKATEGLNVKPSDGQDILHKTHRHVLEVHYNDKDQVKKNLLDAGLTHTEGRGADHYSDGDVHIRVNKKTDQIGGYQRHTIMSSFRGNAHVMEHPDDIRTPHWTNDKI